VEDDDKRMEVKKQEFIQGKLEEEGLDADDEWYYLDAKGQELGPFTGQNLCALLTSDAIAMTTYTLTQHYTAPGQHRPPPKNYEKGSGA
jgi:hypothetical protein